MRAPHGCAAALGSLLFLALSGCEARNLGQPPPGGELFFPSGLLLDPIDREPSPPPVPPSLDELDEERPDYELITLPSTTELDLPGPRYLYVANGNNDRTYNAGTLLAIDLRKFWRAWYDPQRDDPAVPECSAAVARARVPLESAQALQRAARESGDDQWELPADDLEVLRDVVGDAWQLCAARDPRRGGVDPYCHTVQVAGGEVYRCVQPPGSDLAPVTADDDEPTPCRRLPLAPQVAECDERSFVADSVRVGDFATTLADSIEDDGVRLWLPVRGDPSLTYVDVRVTDGALSLECDQGGDPLDPELCGDSHRLDDLRGEAEPEERIDREPFNVVTWERATPSPDPEARGQRLAFVAHSAGSELTLVDLDGIRGGDGPAIVDLAPVYQTPAGASGGYGLAVRPCFAREQGPLGALDPDPNIPSITQGCTRPLVYTSFRFAGQLASFTAGGLELGEAVAELVPPSERVDCSVQLRSECTLEVVDVPVEDGEQTERETRVVCDGLDPSQAADCGAGECRSVYAGQYCATPEQLDQPCAVECEPQVRSTRRIATTLIDPFGPGVGSVPVLGAMAFADPRGDQLLVLQTNPGALLSLDTSIGDAGEPLDVPSAPPVEICAEPSNMKIYVERSEDGLPAQRYAIISCFRAAMVYVVDLEALRVVDAVVVGTGPHDIAIDEAREVAYVINNLESSISVIDLSRRRATRFQELARLGLQDPFSQ